MGFFFILLALVTIVGTVIVLVAKLLWNFSFVKKLMVKLYDLIVFNSILRSIVQVYIVFSTSILLNCANPKFTNFSTSLSSSIAFISAIVIAGLPFFLGFYLLKN